jgi:hypothetical protein
MRPIGPEAMSHAGRSAAAIRGVYLWAGSATIDLHRAKFPDRAIDRDAHMHAHSPAAADALAERGINWAFLSMNWGFPPELETTHWMEYELAARTYNAAGIRVIGYVQASNCLASGSYADRDWYAVTPTGRRIPYFRNRLMTCWNAPAWIEEVGRNAERAIELGGDGVFFDNLWMAATPWTLGTAAGGFAGCACARCRWEFERSNGVPLPSRLEPDAASSAYLAWRSGIVTRRLAGWRERVRLAAPEAVVSTNSCDAVLRDTRTLFGQSLPQLAPLQDAMLVENVAMPRFSERRRKLVANAIPLKAVRAVAGQRPVLAVTYENGIGLDGPPPSDRLRRAVAEAAAVGAAPVLKGSEYLDTEKRFTVITAPALRSALDDVAPLLRWMASNPRLFEGGTHAPLVQVLYDAHGMDAHWAATAPGTLATALALVREGIPFAFVTTQRLEDDDHANLPLLVPPGIRTGCVPVPSGRSVTLEADDVGGLREPSRLFAFKATRHLADRLLGSLSRAYFGSAPVRRLIDGTGATARFLQSPFFEWSTRSRVLERCGVATPVRTTLPALVERWRLADGAIALHIVNYTDGANVMALHADVPPRLHTPDRNTRLVRRGQAVHLELDTYAVLEWTAV